MHVRRDVCVLAKGTIHGSLWVPFWETQGLLEKHVEAEEPPQTDLCIAAFLRLGGTKHTSGRKIQALQHTSKGLFDSERGQQSMGPGHISGRR